MGVYFIENFNLNHLQREEKKKDDDFWDIYFPLPNTSMNNNIFLTSQSQENMFMILKQMEILVNHYQV
jgi:hypothetical protein